MKSKLLVLSAALMLVLAGCGGKGGSEFKPSSEASESSSQEETVAVTGVQLSTSSLELEVGESSNLLATVLPENASNKAVTWSATGDGVVSVDDGEVSALKAGSAVVTATTVDGGFTASCNVTVEEAEQLGIGYSDGTFDFNGTEQRGKFVYWAGDGGAVSSATYNASTGKYTLAYTTGWAWYGVQIFYLLPYQEAGDKVNLTWTVKSTAAGTITINGAQKQLVSGENVISLTNSELSQNRTLNVQLGVDGGAQFAAGTLEFNTPVVYDASSLNYHPVSFTNGTTLVKYICVKDGKLVTAPADPTAPSGQVFSGWFDGETRFDATQPVTKEGSYFAKFINESEATKYTVTVYDGSTVLATLQVLENTKVDLSSVEFPFGYEAAGYYKNSGLTEVFDPAAETITAATNIYAKKQVAVSNACYNIYDAYVSHLEDGSLQLQLEGWGSNVWDVQLNYVLPVGNYSYRIDFVYSIDKNNADVQIYDGSTKAGPTTLEIGTKVSKTITYSGALSDQNKLTFELGNLPASQVATFVLHSITLTIA